MTNSIELKTSKEALEFQVDTLTEAMKKRIEDGGVGLDLDAKLKILHDARIAHDLLPIIEEILAVKPLEIKGGAVSRRILLAKNDVLEQIQTLIKERMGV